MELNKIKTLTIRALMSDEKLMYGLVLKGGNALQLVYKITDRASMDIDFSMENDFTEFEYKRLDSELYAILNDEFSKHQHTVFDVKLKEKPKSSSIREWKGYNIEFKITQDENFFEDIEKTRRNAIKIKNQSTKFSIDISSFEYIKKSKKYDLEGTVLRVYTPEMIVIEKLRALCQSLPEYKNIVSSAKPKGRARDLYDIWNLSNQFNIDLTLEDNIFLISEIFEAKRVPLNFLNKLPDHKDLQKENWESVVDTLMTEKNNGFDYYFDYTLKLVESFKSLLDSRYSN